MKPALREYTPLVDLGLVPSAEMRQATQALLDLARRAAPLDIANLYQRRRAEDIFRQMRIHLEILDL